MESFGKFVLLVVNVCINVFLLSIVVLLSLWLILKIPPNVSVQKAATWVEHIWRSVFM